MSCLETIPLINYTPDMKKREAHLLRHALPNQGQISSLISPHYPRRLLGPV